MTSSLDRTIKVWSYQNTSNNNVKLEIIEQTFDEILSLALHISGNYLVAAFNSFIWFFNIFTDKLKNYHELPIKMCKEMKFSNYGNLIAF